MVTCLGLELYTIFDTEPFLIKNSNWHGNIVHKIPSVANNWLKDELE
jgi:hypothetical protein